MTDRPTDPFETTPTYEELRQMLEISERVKRAAQEDFVRVRGERDDARARARDACTDAREERDEAQRLYREAAEGETQRAAERDAAQATTERYRQALKEISGVLDCEAPCDMSATSACGTCGHKSHQRWCAGCVARAALSAGGGE